MPRLRDDVKAKVAAEAAAPALSNAKAEEQEIVLVNLDNPINDCYEVTCAVSWVLS